MHTYNVYIYIYTYKHTNTHIYIYIHYIDTYIHIWRRRFVRIYTYIYIYPYAVHAVQRRGAASEGHADVVQALRPRGRDVAFGPESSPGTYISRAYTCICVCMCTITYIYVCIYIYICMYMCTYMYIYICVCMCTFVCVCVGIRAQTCTDICKYTCGCMGTFLVKKKSSRQEDDSVAFLVHMSCKEEAINAFSALNGKSIMRGRGCPCDMSTAVERPHVAGISH